MRIKGIELEKKDNFREIPYLIWDGKKFIIQYPNKENNIYTFNGRLAADTPIISWDDFKARYTISYDFKQDDKDCYGHGKIMHNNLNTPYCFIFWEEISPRNMRPGGWIDLNDDHLTFKDNLDYSEIEGKGLDNRLDKW